MQSDEIRPMRLNRWAQLYWFDGEWEVASPQTVYVYEPLDTDAPEGARVWFGFDASRVQLSWGEAVRA